MKISFKQRIMAAVVLAALVPMCAIGGITAYMGYESGRAVSEAGVGSMEEATRMRVKDYLESLIGQIKFRASEPFMIEAFKEFKAAEDHFDASKEIDNTKLKERYAYQAEKTKGAKPEDAANWIPTDPKAIALQTLYIANNPNKIGEKQLLDAASDGSQYSVVHAKYHPPFREFVKQFGLYDFFLIDAESGRVIYTNFKEIDFQSNVKTGNLADSGFSRLVKQALGSNEKGKVFMSDIEPYMPSYNDGTVFMATPIIENGKTIGALAIQVPIENVNGMFAPLKQLGATVDGAIVGSDLTYRTPQTAENGKVGDKVNENLGKVITQVFENKKPGIYHYPGSDGYSMTGSISFLDLPGVDWVIVVGQDDDEMLASTNRQIKIVMGIILLAVFIVLAFGWFLGSNLSRPVVKLGSSFSGSTEKVGRSTGMVGDAVASMIAASEETSAQSTVVRRNSSEAAQYVGSVSSAVEELNTSIHDISQSIYETNVLVDDAVGKAQHTDEVVSKLGEASGRITEVVGLINDLAAQTNLLALNAAIEAARAGDAGRGFAVVADEVKKLASHTTQATVDIGAQIHEIQSVTKESAQALQAVVQAIHRIRDNATAVSAAVEEQSGVAKHISNSVQDAAQRVHQVDENMTGIEQAANDTGVAADQVNVAVREVQGALGEMKQQMDRVLDDMGIKS